MKSIPHFVIYLFFLQMTAPIFGLQNQNSYYVLNIEGAFVYENPSLNSKIIDTLKVGHKISAKEILKTSETIRIGKGFELSGDFIKVETANQKGYLFSSDLTQIKPKVQEVYKGIYIANIHGKKLNSETRNRTIEGNNSSYVSAEEFITYENVNYLLSSDNGCNFHSYFYKKLSLSEVYHQLRTNILIINESENKLELPKFIKKIGRQYIFQSVGLTEGIQIRVNESGTISVSHYDCN